MRCAIGARERLRSDAMDDAAARRGGRFRHRHRKAIFSARAYNLVGRRTRKRIGLEFIGEGIDEAAIVSEITGNMAPALKTGDVVVRIDPRYFRPAEVETL